MTDDQARKVLKKHAAAYGDSRYEPARWVVDAVQDAVAAERERWEQERKDYRSLLGQARLVLRGPHTEQNIVVRELVARIEARGVQFRA